MKGLNVFIISTVLALLSCVQKPVQELDVDFKSYYDKYSVKGSFVLYDAQTKVYTVYNQTQVNQVFTPASTFKICNSLIGLETGVISDQTFVIPWDSIERNPFWDKDHDLKMAFKNSTVWYYQELARRVGAEKMKFWIDKVAYGNADTSGGIDMFWLQGGLRISPMEQIDFLSRLYNNELPFSQRNVDILKEIMLVDTTSDYKLYGKTGWGMQGDQDVGWYVGFVEKGKSVYFFSNCVQADSKSLEVLKNAQSFDESRKEIVSLILLDLGII